MAATHKAKRVVAKKRTTKAKKVSSVTKLKKK